MVMKVEMKAMPKFWFNLTPDQLKALNFLSKVHYDWVCKSASMERGFIYGWTNQLDYNPTAMVSASWGEIDTCIKICEGMMSHFDGYEHMKELDVAFRSMLDFARELIHPIEHKFDTPQVK